MDNKSDIIIIGAGIAGLVCALESLKKGKTVTLIDAQSLDRLGGLARVAFGGMALIGTPEQKSRGINDTPEIAYQDWCSFAEFGKTDHWPRQWAKYYVENSVTEIYEYIRGLDVKFLPAVNWVERGLYVPGNTLPRYHILWGASLRLVNQLIHNLQPFEGKSLTYQLNTKVTDLIQTGNTITGCLVSTDSAKDVEFYADSTIIASGGFTGNLDKVREVWPKDWGPAQQGLLNGTHPDNDGKMHDCAEQMGGQLTNMQNMWNYAAGIANPNPDFDNNGLSLIPCRSALWVDHKGKRIGPDPLVTGFDTVHMCRQINQLQIPHSWQILNYRIAIKELAISGCEHNQSIRDRKFLTMMKDLLLGNKKLTNQMLSESDHFIVADTLPELIKKMKQLTPDAPVSSKQLSATIHQFDNMVKRGEKFWNDEQIRRILAVRTWSSDKLRTCYPKPLLEHGPLIAIKLNLITRKCLGGIKTDLQGRVLDSSDNPIDGLYSIGEASGFGGGGSNGKRSLEGTFLPGCILTARQTARYL